MLDKNTERLLQRMDRMGFAGAGEALREIKDLQRANQDLVDERDIFKRTLDKRDAEIEQLRYDLGLEQHSNARLRGEHQEYVATAMALQNAVAEIEQLRDLRDTMLKGEVAIRQRDADEIERLRKENERLWSLCRNVYGNDRYIREALGE